MAVVQHFYKKPLPSTCISFASDEGKNILKEALNTSYMQGYFQLAAHFSTQSEPTFCGLSTLATVLNALEVDPHRVWKGPWRWYDESMFDCCIDLEDVKQHGITLNQFVDLADCNGLVAEAFHPSAAEGDDSGEAFFRSAVKAATSCENLILVASFARAVLQQTGDGHFTTVAGYHEPRDLVLLLDSARFKYPPHWVPVSLLYEAMKPADSTSGLPRGYCLLRKADEAAARAQPPRLAVSVAAGRLHSAIRLLCASLNSAALSDTVPESDELWSAILDVLVKTLFSTASAPPASSTSASASSIVLSVADAAACSPDKQTRCHAAAVGSGWWNAVRRGVEQSPVYPLCRSRVQLLPRRDAAASAVREKYGCCRAAVHAAAALQPSHQLALVVLSWPFSSGCNAACADASKKLQCCSPDAFNMAVATENYAKDMVSKQGNALLVSVTDLLRARIVLLLMDSTASG